MAWSIETTEAGGPSAGVIKPPPQQRALGGTRLPNLLIRRDLRPRLLSARTPLTCWNAAQRCATTGGVERRCKAKVRPVSPANHRPARRGLTVNLRLTVGAVARRGPSEYACHRHGRHAVNVGGDRYGSLVGTPWGEVIPDGIGAFGVVVAAAAVWLAQRASSRSVGVSETMAAIEQDRRNTERVPRLSARLESWGNGQDGFALSVWLESPEPLAWIRVVVQEARNMDCPLGFKRGQDGVANELPPMLEAEGIRPAWQTDTLRPLADWNERMAPGTPALWLMRRISTTFSQWSL